MLNSLLPLVQPRSDRCITFDGIVKAVAAAAGKEAKVRACGGCPSHGSRKACPAAALPPRCFTRDACCPASWHSVLS